MSERTKYSDVGVGIVYVERILVEISKEFDKTVTIRNFATELTPEHMAFLKARIEEIINALVSVKSEEELSSLVNEILATNLNEMLKSMKGGNDHENDKIKQLQCNTTD